MSAATVAGPRRRTREAARVDPAWALLMRFVAFAALAAFAVGHWTALVVDPPMGRVVLVVVVCLVGGVGLQATAALPRRYGLPLRLGVVVGMLAASLAAIGLDPQLLRPAHWDELYDNVDRGLVGVASINWPYDGPDEWVRLTVILLGPVLAALAAAFTFWPTRTRRGGTVARTTGLCILLVLYCSALAEHRFGADLFRGLVLFGLIGAWLWLPRLPGRQGAVGAGVVLAVGLAALPMASALDRADPLLDYRNWNPFGADRGATFDWNHQYGPLTWTRTGKTLLYAKSSRRYYWKVAALDYFDGLYWREARTGTNPRSQLPPNPPRRWFHNVDITIRRLESERLVGAGTMVDVEGLGPLNLYSDGSGVLAVGKLEQGDSYSFRAYVPQPSRAQLRAASEDYEDFARAYTHVELPAEGRTATETRPGAPFRGEDPDIMLPPPPGLRGGLEQFDDAEVTRQVQRVLASPYAPVYRRTQDLVAGSPTIYDAVQRIYRYLHDNPRFRYSERVPTHPYPLVSFIQDDPRGYCQHFSGAMALMLRLAGIPARVSAGFAPGSYNRDTKEYRVRDLDAHSWVEVYFAGIGWVPFDPTPPLAPPSSQARSGSAATGDASDLGDRVGPAPGDRPQASGDAFDDGSGGKAPLWLVPLGLVAVALVGAAVVAVRGALAARRDPEADIHELQRALERLGWRMPAGTTLQAVEQRLRRVHSERAAAYPAKLSESRYGRNGPVRPTRAERRALRSALTVGGGPLSRLKGIWLLPPRVGRP